MAWMAKLDARAATWWWPFRVVFLAVKWYLVVIGAFLLVGNYAMKWGSWTAAWFIAAPLLYGLYEGLRQDEP